MCGKVSNMYILFNIKNSRVYACEGRGLKPASHVVVLMFRIWRAESHALQESVFDLCLARCWSLIGPMPASRLRSAAPCSSFSPM